MNCPLSKLFAKCCCLSGMICSHCLRLTMVVVAIGMGVLVAWKPRKIIEMQIALYRPFNWKIEPISMEKEVRNTRLMGLAVLILGIFSFIYISFIQQNKQNQIFLFMKNLFFIALFTLSVVSMGFSRMSLQKFEPPDGKTLLFIGQDNATIERYIRESGCPLPAGFMIYTGIQEMDGLDAKSKDYGSGVMFADNLVKKYPNTALQIGLYMVDALGDIPQGKYDANIRKLADWCKKTPVPIFLRIGYEFDGPHNHYNPQQYQNAYRYIVDELRQAGVDNVAFVWHAHAHYLNSPIQNWYPGDDYVDWVGISYFSQHPGMIKPTVVFAKAKGKPLMIAESTPQGNKTSAGESVWRAWYQRYFLFIEATNVKAVSYINSNWDEQPMWIGQNWGDARIQANEDIKARWRNEITKKRYLHSSSTRLKSTQNRVTRIGSTAVDN